MAAEMAAVVVATPVSKRIFDWIVIASKRIVIARSVATKQSRNLLKELDCFAFASQ